MNAQNDNTTPPRAGMRRLIPSFEFRHLRGFGVTRIAGGSVQAAAGLVCLSYGVYGWAGLLPGPSGTESRGWLLVSRHRSLCTCLHLSRAACPGLTGAGRAGGRPAGR